MKKAPGGRPGAFALSIHHLRWKHRKNYHRVAQNTVKWETKIGGGPNPLSPRRKTDWNRGKRFVNFLHTKKLLLKFFS